MAGTDNILTDCALSAAINSAEADAGNGESVEYVHTSDVPCWFPIRATYNRALKIYNQIRSIDFGDCVYEPYIPFRKKVEYSNEDFKKPTETLLEEPLDPTLFFVRTTHDVFRKLLDMKIEGLTPFYNHFNEDEFGHDIFLTVPNRQMESFRIIVDSGNEHIVIAHNLEEQFAEGEEVIVIGGPFAGVEGKVLKYKRQLRVFVELPMLGYFGTAYVSRHWLRKKNNSQCVE